MKVCEARLVFSIFGLDLVWLKGCVSTFRVNFNVWPLCIKVKYTNIRKVLQNKDVFVHQQMALSTIFLVIKGWDQMVYKNR